MKDNNLNKVDVVKKTTTPKNLKTTKKNDANTIVHELPITTNKITNNEKNKQNSSVVNKSAKTSQKNITDILTNDKTNKKTFKVIALQFLAFLCFSLGAAVIEISSFSIIILMGSIVVADIISVILSCLFNFTLNRKYTFKSANNIYLGMILYGIFYLIFTPLGAWFIKALVDTGMNEFLAKFIKMLINFVLDFCFCKFVIFNSKLPKQKQKQKQNEKV